MEHPSNLITGQCNLDGQTPDREKFISCYKGGIYMRKKVTQYNMPPWIRNTRNVIQQFSIPFAVFQGIRTFFFPTTFDLFLLVLLIGLALAFHFDIL